MKLHITSRNHLISNLILLPSPYVFGMFKYAPTDGLIGHYLLHILAFYFFSSILFLLSAQFVFGENLNIKNREHIFQDIFPIYFWAFIKCIIFCLFLLVLSNGSDCIDYRVVSCFYDQSEYLNINNIREMPHDYDIFDFFFGLYNIFILFFYQALELQLRIYNNKNTK